MPTPTRPDWITAVANLILSPEGVPAAAPDWLTTGRLGSFVHADPLLIQSLSAAIEQRCSIVVRQYPALSLSLRPPINRGENCDAEEERNENQSQYAGGQLLSPRTMRDVNT
jgi:hypothetical protein